MFAVTFLNELRELPSNIISFLCAMETRSPGIALTAHTDELVVGNGGPIAVGTEPFVASDIVLILEYNRWNGSPPLWEIQHGYSVPECGSLPPPPTPTSDGAECWGQHKQ